MKRIRQIILIGLLGLLANVLSCTDKSPKEASQPEETASATEASQPEEAVANATQRLKDNPNYSWTISTKEADGSEGKLGTIKGKAEKDGVTCLNFTVGGIIPVEVCMKGEKGAAKAMAGWQTFDEIAQTGGTPAAIVRYMRSYQSPAAEFVGLAAKVKGLTGADGAITGELQEEAVIEQLLVGSRKREGQEPPKTTDAKGSVKFWLKKGALTRYEIKVQGKVTAGDRQSDINRTTTVEIRDVGSTKLEVPADAKAKLG